jgi:F420-non-reducing hydrogenase iron-sulfur subunit
LLSQIGLEPERVHMFNMSAAMAGNFVEAAEEMVERVSTLGPSPLHVAPETEPSADRE